jgi:hypothetical protein
MPCVPPRPLLVNVSKDGSRTPMAKRQAIVGPRSAGTERAGAKPGVLPDAKRRSRLGEAISRFITDLDPGIQAILKWRRQMRSLPDRKRPRRLRRIAMETGGVVTLLTLVHQFAPGLLPWHW